MGIRLHLGTLNKGNKANAFYLLVYYTCLFFKDFPERVCFIYEFHDIGANRFRVTENQ